MIPTRDDSGVTQLNRREALALLGAMGGALSFPFPIRAAGGNGGGMTINLTCGMIGVQANQREAVELAHRHGFGSVEAMPHDLARLSESEMGELKESMAGKGVVFGAAGLPVDFRQDEERFAAGMKELPKLAAGLERAGVTRIGTWLMPGHNELTHLQNLKQHTRRLAEAARVLGDHGLNLGLEYVGTKTLRDRFRFEFIHTMAETKELLAEMDRGNAGFVLDSWHWWNAEETAEDILTLTGTDVIAVDLNDAPAGIPRERQMDGERELPMATGVIPAGEFLRALRKIGYEGPVRAEPFNRALNELNNEEACAKTSKALHRAFALVEED